MNSLFHPQPKFIEGLFSNSQKHDYEMIMNQDCICECHFLKRNKQFKCSLCGCEQEAEFVSRTKSK